MSSPAYTPAAQASGRPDLNVDQSHPSTTTTAAAASFPTHQDLCLQWLFSASDMPFTPSVSLSGLSTEQERAQRWKGIHFLCRIAEYARLGNHVIATSAYFFHRFYMRRPLPRNSSLPPSTLPRNFESWAPQEMAPTCLWLACKVEESHRKLHSIVEATMAVNDRTQEGMLATEQGRYRADPNTKEYSRWKDLILLNEERLLETLCFDLIIDQPHPLAVKACKRLGTDVDLARLTVVYLNSLLYCAVCTFFDAPILAACAFKVACNATETDTKLFLTTTTAASSRAGRPSSSSTNTNGAGPSKEMRLGWLEVFDVSQEELEEAMPIVQEFLDYHMDHLTTRAGVPKADPRLHGAAQNGTTSGGVTPHHQHHHSGADTPRSGQASYGYGTTSNTGRGSSSSSRSCSPPFAPSGVNVGASGGTGSLGAVQTFGSSSARTGTSSEPRLPSATPPPLPPPPPLRTLQRDVNVNEDVRPPSRHGTVQGSRQHPAPSDGGGGAAQQKRTWEEGPGTTGPAAEISKTAENGARNTWDNGARTQAHGGMARKSYGNHHDEDVVRSPQLSPGAAALGGSDTGGRDQVQDRDDNMDLDKSGGGSGGGGGGMFKDERTNVRRAGSTPESGEA